ncbi:alpha/beta hydrolase [Phycicoccus sp.]|uniref:alpha/beta hydrolase n=1 Tax=Phycicoccus sp. TaxID=1902410 RepID=UPI002BC262B6|nr:alpha/beta hydrolase [Phycicoccus sp.]HMM94432.1 alpha/beta hydrolase [Phycicoccus sp.]
MTSWQTLAVRAYLRATRKKRYRTVEAGRRSLAVALPAAPLPDALRSRATTVPLAGGELVTLRPAAAGGPGTLVYLHGGAFVNGIQPQHWTFVAHLADATGREVHVARYPLAPAHVVSDARTFLAALHERLVPDGPVHLLGDSAGGTLALLHAQRHAGDGTVAGLTLIAPWLDLSLGNPAIDAVERRDPWLTRAGMRPIAEHWAAGADLTDPAVSPLYGELSRLPPTAVFVGSHDICRPDCERLVALAPPTADLALHVEPGSPHDYPLLPTPEGRRARDAVVAHVLRTLRPA